MPWEHAFGGVHHGGEPRGAGAPSCTPPAANPSPLPAAQMSYCHLLAGSYSNMVSLRMQPVCMQTRCQTGRAEPGCLASSACRQAADPSPHQAHGFATQASSTLPLLTDGLRPLPPCRP
jgi:hypothetical protein